MIRLTAKLWTVVLVGLGLFTLLLAGENLYSRPLLSLFVYAIHGGSLPPRMWIPANASHSAIKVKRIRTKTARADVGVAPAGLRRQADRVPRCGELSRGAGRAVLEFRAAVPVYQD